MTSTPPLSASVNVEKLVADIKGEDKRSAGRATRIVDTANLIILTDLSDF